MAFLGKNYILYKQENFEDFLRSAGTPEDKIQAITAFKSEQKLEKNGDTYTYYSVNLGVTKETTFKSGVEFEDTIGPEKLPIKSTITVDGNNVTQTITSSRGNIVFKREYIGDELVATVTSDKWDGICTRYYKASS